MTIKTRRSIFYSLLFLFVITGLAVVLYSQGWRLNVENCRLNGLSNCSVELQKTGAIFIETRPKGVVIKIDDKVFQDKSGLIQSGTLIGDLLPKNYKVKIEKEGYLPLEKNLQVKSGLVAELLEIVLPPEKPEKDLISISKAVDNFWINPQQKIVFKNGNDLYYLQDSSPNAKLRGNEFVQWSEDGNKIILQNSGTKTYYLYELNDVSKTFNVSASLNNLKKTTINEISFNPIDSNKLIIEDTGENLYLFDLNRLKLENVTSGPVLLWVIKNPNISYIIEKTDDKKLTANKLILVSFNLVSKTENFNFELPSSLIGEKFLQISASGNKIAFLVESGGLYLFNQEDGSLKQIAHSAEKFVFSPDNKKIAFSDKDGKINVYFLEDYQNGISKKAGDTISFNIYQKSDLVVENVYWYKDSQHLFVEYSKTNKLESAYVDFIEIDDRLPINKYTLLKDVSDFYYEPISSRLYFTQENNFYFVAL